MAFSIKICGLKDIAHAREAVMAGATHLGFVFFPPSPRHVTMQAVKEINNALEDENSSSASPMHPSPMHPGYPASIGQPVSKVALVVDPEPDFLKALLQADIFDAVQFQGGEGADVLAAFKNQAQGAARRIEIWKALGVRTSDDLTAAAAFSGVADRLLFDARPPKGADRPGGHGAAFDWSVLKAYDGASPWVLAGGLMPDNVGAAGRAVKGIKGFSGVDVSSGVEGAPGEKDPNLIRRFIEAARAAQ